MKREWRDCCRRCKKATVVTDHVARRTICSHCGLEFEYHSIEDGVDVTKNDTIRLGDPINPFLSSSDMSIVTTTEPKNGSFVDFLSLNLENSLNPGLDPVSIAITQLKNGSSDDFLSLTLRTSQNRGSDPVSIATTETNTASLDGFDPLSIATTKPNKASSDDVIVSIAEMSDRLELPATVKDDANEIFKEVENYSRGKELNVLFAACIYIACRYNDRTRSMEEISTVANEATVSDITKAVGFIAEKLKMDKNRLMSIKAVDFIKRFCFKLGLDSEAVKVAQEAAKSYDNITKSRRGSPVSPVSAAAGVVYAIARLSYEKKLLKDIIEVTGVTENTIKGTYKDLYPKLSTITPKWFAKPKDLKDLGSP